MDPTPKSGQLNRGFSSKHDLRARLGGVFLLALALGIYWLSVVSIDSSMTDFFDLMPEPDATEYFAGAVSLHREGTFKIHVAGQNHPPRYPFGYSFLMMPVLHFSEKPVEVPFLINRWAGLLSILLLFTILWRSKLYWEAGLAALLLTTLPAFIILTRSPMSEVVSGFFTLLAFYFLYLHFRQGGLHWSMVGALLLGLTVCLRASNLFFAPVVLTVPVLAFAEARERWKHLLPLAASYSIGLSPLVLYYWFTFGTPLKHGYSYWVPGATFFSPLLLGHNLAYLVDEIFPPQSVNTMAWHYGERSFFVLPLVILAGLALWVQRRRRSFHVLASGGYVFTLMMLSYSHCLGRLFYPVILLSLPWIAVSSIQLLSQNRSRIQRIALSFLLLSQLSTFPGRSFDPDFERYVTPARLYRAAPNYQTLQEFRKIRRPDDRLLILASMSPPYVYALTSGDRIVSPLLDTHGYRYNPQVLTYGSVQRRQQVDQALAEGRQVYALIGSRHLSSLMQLCSPPEGFIWRVLSRNSSGGGIAKLVPSLSQDVYRQLPR